MEIEIHEAFRRTVEQIKTAFCKEFPPTQVELGRLAEVLLKDFVKRGTVVLTGEVSGGLGSVSRDFGAVRLTLTHGIGIVDYAFIDAVDVRAGTVMAGGYHLCRIKVCVRDFDNVLKLWGENGKTRIRLLYCEMQRHFPAGGPLRTGEVFDLIQSLHDSPDLLTLPIPKLKMERSCRYSIAKVLVAQWMRANGQQLESSDDRHD